MGYPYTLRGYSYGEVVEYASDDGGWILATIVRLDAEDDDLPFKISFHDGETAWVQERRIRKVNGAVAGRKLQYRNGATWYDIELTPDEDLTFSAYIAGQYVEFRYAPKWSADEILKRIRDERSANGGIEDWKLRELLNGEF
jgi:hypothetical protein